MAIVQFSEDEKLVLPRSLGRSLGLREGDRVEVRRQGDVLLLDRTTMPEAPGPLTDLAKIISTSLPIGSVDIDEMMRKRGYEQIDERSDI